MQSWSKFKSICPTFIDINIDAINVKIEWYKKAITNDKAHEKIYKVMIDYLKELSEAASKSGYIVCSWGYDDKNKCLVQLKQKLYNVKQLGLNVTDFMYEDNDYFLEVNTLPVIDMVTAATCYNDLGFAQYEVDNRLKDAGSGIATTVSSEEIYKIFGKDIYNELYQLRIDDNDFYFDKTMISILGVEHKMSTDTYAEFLTYNANQVMTNMVYKYVSDLTNSETKKIQFIGILENSIYFRLNGLSNERVKEIFTQDCYVKAFGRNVKVTPIIRVS